MALLPASLSALFMSCRNFVLHLHLSHMWNTRKELIKYLVTARVLPAYRDTQPTVTIENSAPRVVANMAVTIPTLNTIKMRRRKTVIE